MSGWIQAAMQQNTNDYIENHGLGTHNDKIYAKSSTGNTTSTPQFIWPICMLPKSANFWVIFEKAVITCPLSMIPGEDLILF